MGFGDKLMGIGDAWTLHQRIGKRVAIGDGRRVDSCTLHHGLSHFLVSQGEADFGADIAWVTSFPGHRPYIDYGAIRSALNARGEVILKHKKMVARLGHYIWKADYRATPAPIKLSPGEEQIAATWAREPWIAIEPNIKASAPPSKAWGFDRFQEVAKLLGRDIPVRQISPPGQPVLDGVENIPTSSFREALAVLKGASLYIGPEGGLHHGAAAVGTDAVVLFGGFISPQTTGYEQHINLTGGAGAACGTRYERCPHCVRAFANITPQDVVLSARKLLA